MNFEILRGKFSKKAFGCKLVIGRYTVQAAGWRFGVYDSVSCVWMGEK